MHESKLEWYEHVVIRKEEYVGKRLMRCAGAEKERKTEVGVNGQHQARLNRDYRAKTRETGVPEAAGQKRRPHIQMGKYEDEEDVDFDVKSKVNYVHKLEFKPLHHGLFLLFNLSW